MINLQDFKTHIKVISMRMINQLQPRYEFWQCRGILNYDNYELEQSLHTIPPMSSHGWNCQRDRLPQGGQLEVLVG